MTLAAILGNSLFDAVVEASGLASVFGPAVIARALNRVGVNSRTMTRQDLAKALPALEQALLIYLPRPEVRSRLSAIEQLAAAR
ncbi:hypothetical protein LZC95_10200 [Pendulispora brunnea]|uniref:Uncharacterized protein n=1 Tax=Pendulispora brunnea TaxID=2905690 RepID=A0ABZ2KJF9_9BACT